MPKLFSGLKFVFFPPKTVHRLNSIKATSSARHGAVIQTRADSSTTHVIVAPNQASPVFWHKLSLSHLSPQCVVVNDRWPSDCIDHNELLDTRSYEVREQKADQPEKETEKEDSAQEPVQHPVPKEAEQKQSEKKQAKQAKPPPVKLVDRASEEHIAATEDHRRASAPSSPVKKARRENAVLTPERGPPQGVQSPERSPSPGIPQNRHIIEVFHDLMLARQAAGEEFSERAYARALRSLENMRTPIVSGQQAQALTGISGKMAALIDDILGGRLHPLVSKSQHQRIEVMHLFTTVYGIGTYHARKLYDAGHRTLADIRPVVDRNGQVSIDHHQDFLERMSRTEVSQHFAAVKALMAKIDPKVELHCMGSYRRGQLDCGDIDIILTKPNAKMSDLKKLSKQLIQDMFRTELATYTFTKESDRWLGATQVIGRWRRMDILLVPWAELGAALIYYTGNDSYNRELRLHAKRRQMRLNQNGLFKLEPHKQPTLIESQDEKKIFEILGRPYLAPEQRNM